jgi:hypothetical protein
VVRLAVAVVAVVVVAFAGVAVAAFGLVPHRVPAPSIDASDEPHDFPDLEPVLPAVVAGRAGELRSSFDGTQAADDEGQFGGVYSALTEELGDDVDRLQMAEEYVPGATDADWTSITAYRLPGRIAGGWDATLSALLANRVDAQLWTFRHATVAGRDVLVGDDPEGRPGDWIVEDGDVLVEIMSDDERVAEDALRHLP